MHLQPFDRLGLAEAMLRAVNAQNFTSPTPIQAGAIPPLLDGRDLLGIAQTGTGKTAAFALPILQHLAAENFRPGPYAARALVLAPTRELAQQIDASIRAFGSRLRLRTAVILGGVSRHRQVQRMASGADIVIGTPGRVCDLLATGHLRLGGVSHFVLDEADRMLDLGFIHDIRRVIAALPQRRQSMLFSATMPAEIGRLAHGLLQDPVRIQVTPDKPTPVRIEQQVYHVPGGEKRGLLARLLQDPVLERVIVFTRTKHAANKVAEHLRAAGVEADAIHGNKSQPARERALAAFRSGRARVLVATDIAARGIDVAGITHVVNFDLPNEPESYVHRIGRTARAGAAGIAISFCDGSERAFLRAIERLTGVALTSMGGKPQPETAPANPQRGQRHQIAGKQQPNRPSGRARGRSGDGRMRPAA